MFQQKIAGKNSVTYSSHDFSRGVFGELNVETLKMQALISVSAWKHPL
jgi:hypothetical protein